MPSIPVVPRKITLLSSREADARRGHKRTQRYKLIAAGLLTPPIKRGPRATFWPEHEVEALVRAEIRGDTVEQRRALVQRLLTARKNA